MNTQIFDTPQAMAEALAAEFVRLVEQSDTLTVALSGGSTPKILFDLLAEKYGNLDWSKVHFYWGDERCVPPTDNESNYKMTVDHLLSKIDMPEANIYRVMGENDPADATMAYAQLIDKNLPMVNGLPQFDLMILGIGGDGHTASIFPHEIELLNAKGTCALATHPDSGQKRVTLTGAVINNSRIIVFLAAGTGKSQIVDEVFHQTGDWKSYPTSYIKPANGELTWFMDKAAAAKL